MTKDKEIDFKKVIPILKKGAESIFTLVPVHGQTFNSS